MTAGSYLRQVRLPPAWEQCPTDRQKSLADHQNKCRVPGFKPIRPRAGVEVRYHYTILENARNSCFRMLPHDSKIMPSLQAKRVG